MDYGQLLAQYEDALHTILELELQIWELCSRNDRLQRALSGLDSADSCSMASPSLMGEKAPKPS